MNIDGRRVLLPTTAIIASQIWSRLADIGVPWDLGIQAIGPKGDAAQRMRVVFVDRAEFLANMKPR